MKVGIIIISFNHFLFTKRCVESIIMNTPRNLYEICLVDNGSIDETKDWAKKLLSEGTLDNFINNAYNMGGCKASNQGMERVMNNKNLSHVLVMANDHITTPGWLDTLLQAPYDCVNPFVFYSIPEMKTMDPIIPSLVQKHYTLRKQHLQEDSLVGMEHVLNVIYPEGINKFATTFINRHMGNPFRPSTFILWPGLILYKRKVIEVAGIKDEDFLRFDKAAYADIDYYVRIYLKGFTSGVVLTSYVHHWGSITTRKNGLKQENTNGYINRERGAYQHFIEKWKCDPHDLRPIIKRKQNEIKL